MLEGMGEFLRALALDQAAADQFDSNPPILQKTDDAAALSVFLQQHEIFVTEQTKRRGKIKTTARSLLSC